VGTLEDPSLQEPATENCLVALGVSVTAEGDSVKPFSVGAPEVPATVRVALPATPLAAAVIVASPARCAETSPLEDTVPIELFEVDQVTACVGSVLPAASVRVADSCWVAPTARLKEPGAIAMFFSAPGATTIVPVAVFPSAVAVIVAVPATPPVTSPLAAAVAMCESELDHATGRPVSVFPSTSVACAANCTVEPDAIDDVAGVTERAEMAAEATFSAAVSATPEMAPMIRALVPR